MKILFLAWLMCSAFAMAASPFEGNWEGMGPRNDTADDHPHCRFRIRFQNLGSDLILSSIDHDCDGRGYVIDPYPYFLSGSEVLNAFGQNVGRISLDSVHIAVGTAGEYQDVIVLRIKDHTLIYSEQLTDPKHSEYNFTATAKLSTEN